MVSLDPYINETSRHAHIILPGRSVIERAAIRGIQSKSIVIATSSVGRIQVEAQVTTEILNGVVSLPHGWGHDRPGAQMRVAAGAPGAGYNDVADDSLVDELSGTAAFNGTRVTVELQRSRSNERLAASLA